MAQRESPNLTPCFHTETREGSRTKEARCLAEFVLFRRCHLARRLLVRSAPPPLCFFSLLLCFILVYTVDHYDRPPSGLEEAGGAAAVRRPWSVAPRRYNRFGGRSNNARCRLLHRLLDTTLLPTAAFCLDFFFVVGWVSIYLSVTSLHSWGKPPSLTRLVAPGGAGLHHHRRPARFEERLLGRDAILHFQESRRRRGYRRRSTRRSATLPFLLVHVVVARRSDGGSLVLLLLVRRTRRAVLPIATTPTGTGSGTAFPFRGR